MNPGHLTTEELQEELNRRKKAKTQDREAYKNLTNTEVPELVSRLMNVSDLLKREKCIIYQSISDLIKLKFDVYQTADKNQSHTFTTDNGMSLKIGYRVIDSFDDTINVGIAKVNQFLKTLAKDDDSAKLVDVINRLLKKDAKGNLKANRVIELQSIAEKFNSEIFTDGVEIIRKAYKPFRSAFFIEAYYVDGMGKQKSVPLSMTSVDFPEDFDLSFLIPSENG